MAAIEALRKKGTQAEEANKKEEENPEIMADTRTELEKLYGNPAEEKTGDEKPKEEAQKELEKPGPRLGESIDEWRDRKTKEIEDLRKKLRHK